MDLPEIIASGVRSARVARGLTQADLGHRIGVDKQAISKIEAGRALLGVERLAEIAVALGVELADLGLTLDALARVPGLDRIRSCSGPEPGPAPTGDAYLDAVVEGARCYAGRHGSAPRANSGPATVDVGFAATWEEIDAALRRGDHGPAQADGLRGLLGERGAILAGRALEDALEAGARAWVERYAARPTKGDGDASGFVGEAGTWALWEAVLRQGLRGTSAYLTLAEFLDARKIGEAPRGSSLRRAC